MRFNPLAVSCNAIQSDHNQLKLMKEVANPNISSLVKVRNC